MPNARLAQTSDLASLLELYQFSEVSPSVEPKERAEQIWAEMLSHEGVAVFVSCVDAKIVATCMLITAPNLLRVGRQHGFIENVVTHPHICGAVVNRTENEFNRGDSYLYIYRIGVDDDARRQGAGTALITFTRDWARALGLKALQVDRWAFNARAREACGFSPMKIMMRQVLRDGRSS
jgi:GNAT superfamily N-acetyltransferase